jgi:hypothetical protein
MTQSSTRSDPDPHFRLYGFIFPNEYLFFHQRIRNLPKFCVIVERAIIIVLTEKVARTSDFGFWFFSLKKFFLRENSKNPKSRYGGTFSVRTII